MKNKIAILALLFTGFLIQSCGESTEKETGHEEHEDHGSEGTVSLNALQMKTLGLEIMTIEKRNMSQEILVNGTLELPPQEKADISPIMGGIVKKIYVIEGDKVKKGQALATMQHPDFIQLQEDYASTIHEYDYLEKEYLRTKKLYEEKVSSAASYQKAKSAYLKSKSMLASQKNKLSMLGISPKNVAAGKIVSLVNIYSPFNGIISLVETNIGAYAEPMSKLFEVVNINKMHADFMVYEKDISHVTVGQKVFFHSSSILNQEFAGKIHNISPVFEENPRALHIHVDIETKSDKLIPGMYIKGRILVENIETKVVPDDAIVADGEKFYIFVKTKNQASNHEHKEGEAEHKKEEKTTFIMVEVIPGIKNAGFTEIKLLNNLPEDIEIAGSAAYFLIAEIRKESVEHSH